MDFWSLISDIGILLLACLLFGSIAIRLGMSPIVGYLLAGVFLDGPGSLNLIKSATEIEAIAELGVSLLLFSLGLEFSWVEMKRFKSSHIKAGFLQVILTPLLIIGLGLLSGFDLKIVVIMGLMLTLSSTAIVLRTLQDLTEIDSAYGRNSIALLLIQDIAVVPFSIIVSLIAAGNQASFNINDIWYTLAGILVLFLTLFIVLDKLALKALGFFVMEHNREMAMLLTVITGIGSAWLAHTIGLSPAIGAFVAGMFLGNSPFAMQIRADISSLKVILLTLFFGAVGMLADATWIMDNFLLVFLATLSILLLKTVLNSLIFIFCQNTIAIAVTTALCVSQVGEFAFVLGSLASEANLISHDIYQLIISVTISSLLIAPFLIKLAPILGLQVQRIFGGPDLGSKTVGTAKEQAKDEIFVLGFGPAGLEVARRLKDRKVKPVIIDLNKESIMEAESMGLKSYIGDVRQIEVLHHFGLDNAKLVVITIPSLDAVIKAVDNIRRLSPSSFIIVRSRYQAYKPDFEQAGADLVINEEFTVGDKLARVTIQHLRANFNLE